MGGVNVRAMFTRKIIPAQCNTEESLQLTNERAKLSNHSQPDKKYKLRVGTNCPNQPKSDNELTNETGGCRYVLACSFNLFVS